MEGNKNQEKPLRNEGNMELLLPLWLVLLKKTLLTPSPYSIIMKEGRALVASKLYQLLVTLRFTQWIKNVLLFAPFLFSQQMFDIFRLWKTIFGIVNVKSVIRNSK